ncbi:MAG: glycosyltransferase [Nitrospiraceae bacterium]|nr:MAG: glycosyltransferase [Nitrospiraceae bacterium]
MILFWIFAGIALIGITAYLFQIIALRSYTAPINSGEGKYLPRPFPHVSILKPLKGIDDGLFDNLESFCRLDYPRYEIIFALQNQNDPAYKVVKKVKEKYQSLDISIVVEYCDEGLNPKINNLMPAYKKAKYDLILISDSNVRAEKNYLTDITRHMEDSSVGLVSNIIRGVSGRSIGAVFENLHLNSFIAGSVCLLDRFLGMPCVVGKSMMFRKSDLEATGGLTAVKDHLAEDYVIGEKIHRLGKRVVLSNHLINNVNEYWTVGRFLNRHSRWGKMRWKIGGAKYVSELFGNPVFISFAAFFMLPFSKTMLCLTALVSALKIVGDFYVGRMMKAGMHPALYLLAPLKDIIIGFVWFVPILSDTVSWRGNRYIIGRGSILSPHPDTVPRSWKPGFVTTIRAKLAWSKTI